MKKRPFMIVPRRLTNFVMAIAWLSTALISTPITTRDAHALNFDALVIDHPIRETIYRIEKRNENLGRKLQKDATDFIEVASIMSELYHFMPYHRSIPLPFRRLKATDFWLNIPSGTNVIDNYGTNDVEGSGWLRANLGDIDLKKNPLPDDIYRSRTDLFDPSQVIIQKFTSNFLIIASILIIMLFFTCTGLVFLDRFVFHTVLQNCFRSDKNISWHRTKKEIGRFFKFVFKILIIIILYIMLNAGFLFLCHEYIVPIPTVIKIFSVFNIDPVVWEGNIEIGKFGDIGEEYESWSKEQNFSPKTARIWQELLWNYWYILIALMLYSGGSFYLSVFKISMGFFKHYKKGAIRRKYFYSAVDRSRWVKKNLTQDHQECCDT